MSTWGVVLPIASVVIVGGLALSAAASESRPRRPKLPTDPPDPVDPSEPTPPPTIDPRPGELDAFGVPYARGIEAPLWPLRDDRRSATPRAAWARGRVSADFGDPRPYGSSSPSRHHAGEDLRAPRGSVVVASERGRVTAIDDEWYAGTGALLVAFDSGITANFGEVEPGSPLELGLAVGTVVERGQEIARVGRTEMLHFELYSGDRRRTWQWPWLGAAPAELLDPTQYLDAAARTVPP